MHTFRFPGHRLKKTLSFLFILLLIYACSSTTTDQNEVELMPPAAVYYEIPIELKDDITYAELMRTYSENLKGRTVFIDPGHGGKDRYNASRNGKVNEADINLVVSLYLREFLQSADAVVIMSRTNDTTISLQNRSKMANDSKADLFISIHHNSTSKANDNWTNYTSTFYHANDGHYEYEPFEHTLAKYIQRDLSYAMRNSGGLGSFDGTQSDFRIYPSEGLAVLRETSIPSVLVECSFFTNRLEKERLSVDQFNRIEGWGIFLGIAKMFNEGIPEFQLIGEKSEFRRKNLSLYFNIIDESRIDEQSIKVYFDRKIVKHKYNDEEELLSVIMNGVPKGEHDLKIVMANKNGIYAFPYNRKIVIN